MFKFSIRDVLWLTVVVALAVAWWVDRRTLISSNSFELRQIVRRFEEEMQQLNMPHDPLTGRFFDETSGP